ncbi:MAG: YbaB/EbfC family nucleoid-associated protein [Bdellovibrionota bacterium]
MKNFPGGMQSFMKQVQQMQNKAEKVQNELKEREFDGTAGGGAVKVKANGSYQLTSVIIDPAVFKDGDAEMLQDLVITAANDALKTANKTTEDEMSKLTGGMKIPGMF